MGSEEADWFGRITKQSADKGSYRPLPELSDVKALQALWRLNRNRVAPLVLQTISSPVENFETSRMLLQVAACSGRLNFEAFTKPVDETFSYRFAFKVYLDFASSIFITN